MSHPEPTPPPVVIERRYQVFVSSTYRDLIDARQLVMQTLMRVNAIPAGMEMFPAADDDAWTLIKRAIEQSDYYVVIIGGKYGSLAPDGRSFTEREYDYAVQLNKPVMAFLHKKPDELTREQTETDPALWEKLKAFRAKAQAKHCNYWDDHKDLALAVLTSYHHLQAGNPAMGWIRGDRAKTVEDVEHTALLQKRVAELEAELEELRAASDDGTARFAQGNDVVDLAVISNVGADSSIVNITTSWDSLFGIVGSELTLSDDSYKVGCRIATRILKSHNKPAVGLCSVTGPSMGTIQYQFVALRLITVEPGVRRSVWRLTPRGLERLAEVFAVKKH